MAYIERLDAQLTTHQHFIWIRSSQKYTNPRLGLNRAASWLICSLCLSAHGSIQSTSTILFAAELRKSWPWRVFCSYIRQLNVSVREFICFVKESINTTLTQRHAVWYRIADAHCTVNYFSFSKFWLFFTIDFCKSSSSNSI